MPVQTRQSSTIKDEKLLNKEEEKVLNKKAKKRTEISSSSKIELESDRTASSFWLMKSEPEDRMQNGQNMKFGIEDLKKMKDQTEHWDGVRNYEARNLMKSMRLGEKSFFYHSNCKTPGIAGIMEIVKEAYPDHTQFDVNDAHYDGKSDRADPKWIMVDVKFVRDLKRFIPLNELKELHLLHKKNNLGPLKDLSLFTRSRLSIQKITKDEWDFILNLENC